MKRKFFGVLCATVLACTSIIPAMPTMSVSAAKVGDVLTVNSGHGQYKEPNVDGYSYEIWLDASKGGSGSMTLGRGCTFKAEWNCQVNQGNFLARRGKDFGSQKKATDYEYIGMDYKASYQQTGSSSGNSRLCVYGWFQNRGAAGNPPLVEYYIIEDWKDWCPDAQGKTVTIDGAQYKIFQMDHTGPSINSGSETFKQYFSVRQSKRTSGHITVSEHFKAWAQQGWGIGNLYEVALNAEGWQSSGVADVTELDVYTDPENHTISDDPGTTPTDTVQYSTPTGSGSGVSDDFEGSGTSWTARGGSSVQYGLTDHLAHGGKKSLYVTGRDGAWNGFQVESSELKAGGTYTFDGYVTYENETYNSETFTLGVMYKDGNSTSYDDIVDVDTTSGKWANLKSNFTIPSGATDIALYIQTKYTENPTAKDLIPFFIDDIKLTSGSTATTTTTTKATTTTTTTTKTTTTTTSTTPKPITSTLKGDVDCSGEVDVADAVLLSRFLAEDSTATISETGLANADVNGTGKQEQADVVTILKAIALIIRL